MISYFLYILIFQFLHSEAGWKSLPAIGLPWLYITILELSRTSKEVELSAAPTYNWYLEGHPFLVSS